MTAVRKAQAPGTLLNSAIVKALLGGKWPSTAFDWDSVTLWSVGAGGYIIPAAGGHAASGPMLRLCVVGEAKVEYNACWCSGCGQVLPPDAAGCPDCCDPFEGNVGLLRL